MMSSTVPILLYHSVSDTSSERFRPWTVSPQAFDEQMRHLRDNQYTPLAVTQFVQAIEAGAIHTIEHPVVITFDDGFADFYTDAYPILGKYACPATIYIVTGYVGQTSRWLAREGEGGRPMMTWEHIAEISAGGIECGGHTHHHPQLDLVSPATARDEIARSKAELEQHLGAAVASFAYPHGYHTRVVREMVIESGYTSACAVKHALSSPHDDRFALGRIIITRDTTLSELDAWLQGKRLPVAQVAERVQTRVWRMVRRSRKKMEAAFTFIDREQFNTGTSDH